jgi:hypothetical protein
VTFAYHQVLYAAIAAPFALLLIFLYDRMQRRRLATRLGELPVLGKVMASTSPRRARRSRASGESSCAASISCSLSTCRSRCSSMTSAKRSS